MAKIGSLLFLISAASAFAADPNPTMIVVVTPNPVVETESVQLRIEIEAGQSPIVFQPTFDASDFVQVGSQPQYGGAPTQRFISGRSVPMKKTFFEYVLSPKRAGNLFIRNIRAKVGSQEIRSADTLVKVLPDNNPSPPVVSRNAPPPPDEDSQNPAAPGYTGGYNAGSLTLPPEDVPESFNSDFTVHASVSKKRGYAGEPIVVEYWLYDFGDLRQMEVQKWPAFNGFWKDDLEISTRPEFEEVFLKGRMMRRAFLGRYALFGLRPGKISLDRLVVRGQYVSSSSMQGFFQMQQVRTGIHGSQDVTIEVLPLPNEGKPEKFSGAVGQFFLKVEADKSTVLQHNPITFTITLQGAGNFQSIDSISLPLPADFEVYESNTRARGTSPIGVKRELESSKVFTVTAVPRKAGSFTVAPLEWQYFDPEKNAYARATTSPIEITVSENASGAQAANSYSTKGPDKAQASPLSPLKSVEASALKGAKKWIWVALAALGGLNAWLLAGWVRRRTGSLVENAFRDSFGPAKKFLAEAQSAKGGKWLSLLEDAIFALSEALLGSNPRGITRYELETLWREKGLPGPLFNQTALLLDKLDQNRFSANAGKGGANEKKLKESLMAEAQSILKAATKIKRK